MEAVKLLDTLGTKTKSYRDNVDILTIYLNEIGKIPRLSQEEERHFASLAILGDKTAREKLIKSNLRLVVNLAVKYKARGFDFHDCIEEGNLGLIHAVNKFNPEAGFRFSTYASYWIKETIQRAFSNNCRNIRLPDYIVSKLNKYLKKEEELICTTGKQPTISKISECVSEDPKKMAEILQISINGPSLDSVIDEFSGAHFALTKRRNFKGDGNWSSEKNNKMIETLSDQGAQSPAILSERTEERQKVMELLNTLTPLQKDVLMRRYGITPPDSDDDYKEEQTFINISKERKNSRESVRLLHNKSIKKLRWLIKERNLTRDDF